MQYARFGKTSMTVSRLSLGTMCFGTEHLGKTECARVVDEALDHGVNLIDTADGYGSAEEILGEVLGPKRDKVFISTKVFSVHLDRPCGRNSRHNILQSAEDSLHKLRTDYVDLFLLHHPDPETTAEETLSALNELAQSGKARYVGLSNHYAWQVAWMVGLAERRGWSVPVTNQVCYNVLDRPAETELVPLCRQLDMPVMAYSPLSGGLLTGRYTRGESLPESAPITTRFGGKIMNMHATDAVHDVLDALRSIAGEQGLSLIEISFLWLLAKPYVGTVLVGGTRPEHFGAAHHIADRKLPEEVVKHIDDLSERQICKPFRNQRFTNAPLF